MQMQIGNEYKVETYIITAANGCLTAVTAVNSCPNTKIAINHMIFCILKITKSPTLPTCKLEELGLTFIRFRD
jgi:hypothetical protein